MECDNCSKNRKLKWFSDYGNYLCKSCFNILTKRKKSVMLKTPVGAQRNTGVLNRIKKKL